MTGIVCIWPFSRETIPNGWQECDGTNGTPDWRGFYLRNSAAGVPPGNEYGSVDHFHTIFTGTTYANADHRHNFEMDTEPPTGDNMDVTDIGGGVEEYSIHTHECIGYTEYAYAYHNHIVVGSTVVQDNLPPTVDVIFIMKM